jgi:UDP-glucose 4-epimerase
LRRSPNKTGLSRRRYADVKLIRRLLDDQEIHAVIHLAGFKAVAESPSRSLSYYATNVAGTALLATMGVAGVKNLIFSSSATVYGSPEALPVTEDSPRSSTNPYGRTKLFIECILEDLLRADPTRSASILRYFNPVGASFWPDG